MCRVCVCVCFNVALITYYNSEFHFCFGFLGHPEEFSWQIRFLRVGITHICKAKWTTKKTFVVLKKEKEKYIVSEWDPTWRMCLGIFM